MKRDNKAWLLVLTLVLVFALVAAVFWRVKNSNLLKDASNLSEVEMSTPTESNTSVQDEELPDLQSELEGDNEENLDTGYYDSNDNKAWSSSEIESEILRIREEYNTIMAAINNGEYDHDGEVQHFYSIDYYLNSGEIKCIMHQPAQSMSFTWLYYKDGELFFVYTEDDDGTSDRLYFSEEQLIRWRHCDDKDLPDQAVNHDCENTAQYLELQSQYLEFSDKWVSYYDENIG